jgi:3-oxoacyl-[acyl-carrier protein] reductase
MDLELKGKVAVVTGASMGIGKAAARLFAKEGASVVICARGQDTLNQVSSEMEKEGASVLAVKADMMEQADIDRLMEAAVGKFGGIDILINNVGDATRGDLLTKTDDDWQYDLNINLYSAIRCARAAVPHMKSRGGGRIINISTVYAKQPSPGPIGYSMAKAALANLSRHLADDLAGDNILVNTVCPGPIMTPLWERSARLRGEEMGMEPQEVIDYFADTYIPLGRFGQPDEVAGLIVFLASRWASFITGTAISTDGGMNRGLF